MRFRATSKPMEWAYWTAGLFEEGRTGAFLFGQGLRSVLLKSISWNARWVATPNKYWLFVKVLYIESPRAYHFFLSVSEAVLLFPHEIIPLRTAYRISSGTPFRFNFSMMFDRCVSTVYTLRFSMLATSLFDFPSTTSCKISRSRGVSRS